MTLGQIDRIDRFETLFDPFRVGTELIPQQDRLTVALVDQIFQRVEFEIMDMLPRRIIGHGVDVTRCELERLVHQGRLVEQLHARTVQLQPHFFFHPVIPFP